jgi:hypothetical protein
MALCRYPYLLLAQYRGRGKVCEMLVLASRLAQVEVAEYVALCDTCQRIKAEHQRSTRLLQPLKIYMWKWEEISMYFVVCLPHR